jgi:hypothetical protein
MQISVLLVVECPIKLLMTSISTSLSLRWEAKE